MGVCGKRPSGTSAARRALPCLAQAPRLPKNEQAVKLVADTRVRACANEYYASLRALRQEHRDYCKSERAQVGFRQLAIRIHH